MEKIIVTLSVLGSLIMLFVGSVHATLLNFTFEGSAYGINEETGWRDNDERYDFTLDFLVSLHPQSNNDGNHGALWDINHFRMEFDNYLIGSEHLVLEGESGTFRALMSDTYINLNGAAFERLSDNHQLLTSGHDDGGLIWKPTSEIFITDILYSDNPGGVFGELCNYACAPPSYHSWELSNGDILVPGSVRYLSVASVPVPEPSTMLLLGPGLIALVGCRKKVRDVIIAARQKKSPFCSTRG